MFRSVCILLIFGLLVISDNCFAGCSVKVQPVVFGGYDTLAEVPLDGEGAVIIKCRDESSQVNFFNYSIVISPSMENGQYRPRRMKSHRKKGLYYNIYTDVLRHNIWGNGYGGTQVKSGRVYEGQNGVTIPVYGRIPQRQDVEAGMYNDSLVVIVEW